MNEIQRLHCQSFCTRPRTTPPDDHHLSPCPTRSEFTVCAVMIYNGRVCVVLIRFVALCAGVVCDKRACGKIAKARVVLCLMVMPQVSFNITIYGFMIALKGVHSSTRLGLITSGAHQKTGCDEQHVIFIQYDIMSAACG